MKVDDLLDVLGEVNPVYIQQAEQIRHKKKTRRWMLSAAACAALLLLGGTYGVWQRLGGSEGTEMAAAEGIDENAEEACAASPEQEEAGRDDTVVSDMETTGVVQSEAAQEELSAENSWYINEVEELLYTVSCGSKPELIKRYTAEELQEYYGIKILPDELPEGYERSDSGMRYEIGYDDVGNVMDDNCTVAYENPQTGGTVHISARTVDIGESTSFVSDGLQQSVVCDTAVMAVHYPLGSSTSEYKDGYLAVYEKEGVTVTVKTVGISEEAFCAVVENLLGECKEITVIHEPYKLLE